MRPLALAFSANLSQRSPKARRSAAVCGELANFARGLRQAVHYVRRHHALSTHTRPARRLAFWVSPLRAACGGHREYSRGALRKTRG